MDEYNPYKNMTLRQELEARFAEVDRKQKEQDALDYIRNNMQFSPNNAGNINTGQQPNGWSSLSNSNSGFGDSIVGQHIDNAVNRPNGNNRQNNDYPQRPNNSFQSPASSTNMPRLPKFSSSNSYPTATSPQKSAVWDNVKTWGNNFADATEAATVGYATGATLGNFDEAMGAATAAVTLNPDNYTMGRDAVRKLQNDLSHSHPWAYGVGEFTGAMTTPMHLAKDTTFANKALNAFTDTISASAGYANDWNDFATNLAVNGAANWLGLKAEQLPIFRASARPLMQLGKKILKQGINSSADKLKNIYYNDDEKYHY